jgi:hypothetical protein
MATASLQLVDSGRVGCGKSMFSKHFWQIFSWDVWCKLDLGSNPQVH